MPLNTILATTASRVVRPSHMPPLARLAAAVAVLSCLQIAGGDARASSDAAGASRLCDRAASDAARRHGVPLDVLRAISRTETGRSGIGGLQPWPWTVNMEGTGRWFASLDEARSHVFRHFKRGARSFDVGCFQINYKWHGAAFTSIDDMFDPGRNADYAAAFLKRLYAETGSWSDAAGAYHSRTPEHANRYSARFERIRATLPDTPITASQGWPIPRTGAGRPGTRTPAHAPLIGRGTAVLGSLVPLSAGAAHPALIGLDERDADHARTQP